MKRILLTLALAFLLAGHADADTFTIDRDTALTFRQLFVGGNGWLQGVFDLTTTPPKQEYDPGDFGVHVYPDNPQGNVGFVGTISGDDSWMRIGVKGGDFGTYTGLGAFVANDNQSTWAVRLFANDYVTEWTYLESPLEPKPVGPTAAWITLPFDEMALTTFGFDVLLDAGLAVKWPSVTDTFHVSVATPVPAAALLGMLGLGMAGMKLRRLV